MEYNKTLSKMMVIAITSITMTACSSDNNEPEKPFTTCPVEESKLYAYGIEMSGIRSIADSENILFSEDDIDSFNLTTSEIKFKYMDKPLYKRVEPFHEIEFRLGDENLFTVSSFVSLLDSRIFDDIVLCYGNQESITLDGKYYLYDCYPLWLADTEAVKANREKNKAQWETFIQYLDSKGKLIR